jgi:hypothetical protein
MRNRELPQKPRRCEKYFSQLEKGLLAMPEIVAAKLSVPQRVLLFCVASNTDWRKAKITSSTVQLSIVQNLIEHDERTSRLKLANHGRAVFAALLSGWDRTQLA